MIIDQRQDKNRCGAASKKSLNRDKTDCKTDSLIFLFSEIKARHSADHKSGKKRDHTHNHSSKR